MKKSASIGPGACKASLNIEQHVLNALADNVNIVTDTIIN
jgi:hypothetical protein